MKTAFRPEKYRDGLKRDIYSRSSDGSFYSPFSLSVDDMEHLILVNFEKDPDEFYHTFELQQARDEDGRRFLLVIAYRVDGGADVYHQPGYPFASQASLLNDPGFIACPLKGARFEVNADRLDAFFAFKDKFDREIEVEVVENRMPKGKPFFLLAPIGTVARNPQSFPVYSLYGMSFTKQKHADIKIEIDGVKHKPDTFPLPIDCAKNYFTRYSADTFNVDWNKNFHGRLMPLQPGANNRVGDRGVMYEIVNNQGHCEIKGMSVANSRHRMNIDFCPPIPDFACLRDHLIVDGAFAITTDKSPGTIRGEFLVKRNGNEIEMRLHPTKGWEPNEKRWILKLLFLTVKVFKKWPKSYAWNAKIELDAMNHPLMRSGWERV